MNSLLGENHQSIKIKNKHLVLKAICTESKISRIDLAKQTGLSKMSITNIVNELIEEGYIMEQADPPLRSVSPGRKPVCLTPSPDKYLALGVYISRDHAVVIAANLKCEIVGLKKCSLMFDETEHSFLGKIQMLVFNVLKSEGVIGKEILGIGISCIGPLDIKNGIILEPPNFHHLHQIHISDFLSNKFSYKVYLDNDMNASALAEKLYGKGKKINNFLYVGVTNGIGAGIIVNDGLFQGDMGFGGEIGHTTIRFDGPECACGNVGCLELYANIPEVVSQARKSISRGMETNIKADDTLEWIDIVNHAKRGDGLATDLIEMLCFYVSVGIVNISNIFDPEAIYLGHDIALGGDLVTERIENHIKDKIISSKYKKIPIKISAFRDQAPVIGSAVIIFDKLFSALL